MTQPIPTQALRMTVAGMGLLWSAGLLLIGFWVWDHFAAQAVIGRLLAIAAIAAGEFVLMWLVLDDALQQADGLVIGFCKAVAGVTFWAALGLTVVLMGVHWVA
ncbi:MAG: hypothetical protein RIG82_11730 [Phycisphaeraceae bacterium]